MNSARVIPCLLLADRRLVKTIGFAEPAYVGDPANTISIFSGLGADEIFLLDIVATRTGNGPNIAELERLAGEAAVPLAFGGAISTVDHVRRVLAAGAEKVVVSTAAFENPNFILAAADVAGSQAIVASIDVRAGADGRPFAFTHGGSRRTGREPVEYARELERLGAGEILLNSIDRDGSFVGYDLALIQAVCAAVRIPVIASGGAGTRQHIRDAILVGGASAAAAGSIFVYQRQNRSVLINYPSRRELEGLTA